MVLRKLLQKYLTIVFEFITVKEEFCLSESLYPLRKYCLFLLNHFVFYRLQLCFTKDVLTGAEIKVDTSEIDYSLKERA